MKVGVLALQGAFIEHIQKLKQLGVETVEVRLPRDLAGLDGLIIPGGESTTIGKLAVMYELIRPLQQFAAQKSVWGTCAGMIFMAKEITAGELPAQPLLGIMDIAVERNAFGRQVDSFEAALDIPALNNGSIKPFPAVFIRAPRLTAVRGHAHILAQLNNGTAVAAQEGHWLVTSFHPELSDDLRFHQYFLGLIRQEGVEFRV